MQSFLKEKTNKSGGSAGGGGYNYQASAIAYVCSHILSIQPLGWLFHTKDLPVKVASETGGPGDDLDIYLEDNTHIEVQVKHGLQKNGDFWATLLNLSKGIANDSNLHAVLLVDTTTSLTIRDNLRNDLVRLAEGRDDELKPITKELLNKLKEINLEIKEIAPRLRIIVIDLHPSSSGEATGKQCLTPLLSDQSQSQAAWMILVKDGLDLITHRGQRDSVVLSRLLSTSNISLSKTLCNLDVLAESFRSWVSASTETFTIAGLGVALPIKDAWMQLQVLSDEVQNGTIDSKRLEHIITKYHEWERLAERNQNGAVTEAEHIAAFNRQVVVVGGPGAGKSTLLKRLANKYASANNIVISVRLPFVAQRMDKIGDRFEDALIHVAGDGSGISFTDLRRLLSSPHYLLADGLDECDPHRSNIADSLVKWAQGHKQATVIVTTRSIGHDPGMFPEWKHFELLPLNKSDALKYGEHILLNYFGGNRSKVKDELISFEKQLETNSVASLAARNPLLLGFLIQLSINKIEIGMRRAGLYNQIIDLIQRIPPQDRYIIVNLENVVASRFLDVFGWILQEDPTIPCTALIKKAGDLLARELDVGTLEGQRKAENALKYWEERRLLERISIVGSELITFVHLAFCEFASARYATTLNDFQMKEWLTSIRRHPKWRETILLAAGTGDANRVIRNLISLDDPGDPTSTEVLLAATACYEAVEIQPELEKSVIDHLVGRLTSNVPLITYEAGNAALGLSQIVPKIIGPMVKALLTHTQQWTRLVAWTLALNAGKEYADFDLLEQSFEKLIEPTRKPMPGGGLMLGGYEIHNIVHSFVIRGIELLLKERRTPKVLEQIERIFIHGNISYKVMLDGLKILDENGLQQIVEQYYAKHANLFGSFSLRIKERQTLYHEADKALLEAIISAFLDSPKVELKDYNVNDLLSLSALFYTFRFPEIQEADYLVLLKRVNVESLIEVIRGATAALNIKPEFFVSEAKFALRQLKSKQNQNRLGLISLVKQVPVTPVWSKSKKIALDGEILARALDHPCIAVAVTAAELIYAGAGGDKVPFLVEQVLKTGGYTALRVIGAFAHKIFGDRACDLILARLNGELTRGCEFLFETLTKPIKKPIDDRVFKCFVKGIMCPNIEIAVGAAESCVGINFPKTYANDIQNAFVYWKEHEPPYTNEKGFVQPSPRKYLLLVLAKLKNLTTNELLEFYSDIRPDVHEAAIEATIKILESNKVELANVLRRISQEEIPSSILKKILNLPSSVLQDVKGDIVNLLRSSNKDIRWIVTSAIRKDWINKEEAIKLITEMLQDENSEIRNCATETLRVLTS